MKNRTPIEPKLTEKPEVLPKLPRVKGNINETVLSSLKKVLNTKTKRSNSKSSSKGTGKIRPQRGFQQKVVIKARVVKMNSSVSAKKNLRAHVQYLVRSGVSKSGESPSFFSGNNERTKKEISEEISNWGEDRHHFRFIISPERGRDLNLEDYTTRLVTQLQKDLGEELNWFATCHYNTDEPHIHLVIRGVDSKGQTLNIAKEYIKHSFRERAQELATNILGHRTELDLKKEVSKNITELNWTTLDYSIEKELERLGSQTIRLFKDHNDQSEVSKIYRELKLQRLQYLKQYDLATEVTPGVWKLSTDAKETLKYYGRLSKIKKLVSKHLSDREALSTLIVCDNGIELDEPIRGEVLGVGYNDNGTLNKYVLVSGDDGQVYYFEPSKYSVANGVNVKPRQLIKVYNQDNHRIADDVLLRFTKNSDGVLSLQAFNLHVRNCVKEGTWKLPGDVDINSYLERFSTRVNSLVETGIVKQKNDDLYQIPRDLHEQVRLLDNKLGVRRYIGIEIESYLSLKQQIKHDGATWLDDPSNIKNVSLCTNLGIKIHNAYKERQNALTDIGYLPNKRTYGDLYRSSMNYLKKELGGQELIPKEGVSFNAEVKKYKILGSGIHEILKTENQFFVRKLKPKESILPLGSKVRIEVENQKNYTRRSLLSKPSERLKGRAR